DDLEHHCQVAADLLTILERKGALSGLRFLYVGDGNNMCHSYLVGMAMAGLHVTVATPAAYAPDAAVVKEAEAIARASGGSVRVLHPDDITACFDGQDVVATDTWISMG